MAVLPEPCFNCSGDGGYFTLGPRGGACRCSCSRGLALAALDEARKQSTLRDVEPLISAEIALGCVSMLGALRFFPTEAAARTAISDEFQSMCNNDSEALWLAKRMLRLFTDWPGVPVLRSVYCSRYMPLDRYLSGGVCEQYPEGIPAELPETHPPRLALPPGHVVSIDAQAESMIRMLARETDMNRLPGRIAPPAPPLKMAVPINSNFKPVTQADIDRAVSELHDRQARDALGSGEGDGLGRDDGREFAGAD
jgi:hypothetical protein